jgi:hypothetical protein
VGERGDVCKMVQSGSHVEWTSLEM